MNEIRVMLDIMGKNIVKFHALVEHEIYDTVRMLDGILFYNNAIQNEIIGVIKIHE